MVTGVTSIDLLMPRREAVIEEEHRQSLLVLLAGHIFQLAAYAAALYHLAFTTTTPQPYHTSGLSGQAWVDELRNGHEDRIACELGVRKHIFNILLAELRWLGVEGSRYVSLEEKLGIFLYTCTTALPPSSSYFREVLDAFTEPDFYNRYVCLPDANAPIPAYILKNPKLYPFFKDAIGTADGTHICCWPSKEERELARDRKGQISHNCLVCCSFDMRVQYAVTGYDGASADATMYAQSRLADLHIPEGKYYIADAGFGTCDNLLVPYRGVRYHLNEWQRGHLRPNNREELFNLRHAQARNIVERIFGVLKAKWGVLIRPVRYSMDIQVKIPLALMAIHNLIMEYDPVESLAAIQDPIEDFYDPAADPEAGGDLAISMIVSEEEIQRSLHRRDEIAQAMWDSYLVELQERENL
ncbi:hypothetical protein MPER_13187 [Moniliophthora perniciosa FA553]|nr:hypothetical protein MPER_13187 [Moniliophthora perniciosa FA553]